MSKHAGANWTSNVPPPVNQNCNHSIEACDQINAPEVAAHKEYEEQTGDGYHTVPAPGEPINYDEEN